MLRAGTKASFLSARICVQARGFFQCPALAADIAEKSGLPPPPPPGGPPPGPDGSLPPPPPPKPQRLVVFGGSGFLGTRVLQAGLEEKDVEIISVSRSGRPAHLGPGTWADQVHWAKGDALDTNQPWRHLLQAGRVGVVSTVGAFGSSETMYRICGIANIELIRAASELGVERFAFISVHDFKFPSGWHAKDYLMKSYFQGKRDAEKELFDLFPDNGVALRPSFMYGSRRVGSGTLPLGLLGSPLAMVMKLLPTRQLSSIPIVGAAFAPPLPVETVGRAAARAALDTSIPPGVMDVWSIERYGKPGPIR